MKPALSLIEWLALIRTARQILRQAADLLDLPDLDDPKSVYGWTRAILAVAAQTAKVTPTTVDDLVVAWLLDGPLATYENFLPLYRVFRDIINLVETSDDDATVAAKIAAGTDTAALAANPAGLDAVTVILTLVKLIRLILELAR